MSLFIRKLAGLALSPTNRPWITPWVKLFNWNFTCFSGIYIYVPMKFYEKMLIIEEVIKTIQKISFLHKFNISIKISPTTDVQLLQWLHCYSNTMRYLLRLTWEMWGSGLEMVLNVSPVILASAVVFSKYIQGYILSTSIIPSPHTWDLYFSPGVQDGPIRICCRHTGPLPDNGWCLAD